VASARRAVAARTRAHLTAWIRGLGIAASVARSGPAADSDRPATVADESAVAANTLAGLNQAAGAGFGDRRVVLLYAPSLAGIIPPGELTGADVIVMTAAVPTAAAVGAAQASLLAAGASRAAILGPDNTAGQLAQLVAAGLSQKSTVTETLSGPALFANDSARLAPAAGRALTPLIAPLRQPGAAAVINGYASTPGTSQANYLLSYSRAEAVADFLEAGGVPASALVLVGHGASDLVAAGSSGANRRVVVVIEEPAAG
jgi:outer membrane protein OmpA-like peptidoglycan-associated protein